MNFVKKRFLDSGSVCTTHTRLCATSTQTGASRDLDHGRSRLTRTRARLGLLEQAEQVRGGEQRHTPKTSNNAGHGLQSDEGGAVVRHDGDQPVLTSQQRESAERQHRRRHVDQGLGKREDVELVGEGQQLLGRAERASSLELREEAAGLGVRQEASLSERAEQAQLLEAGQQLDRRLRAALDGLVEDAVLVEADNLPMEQRSKEAVSAGGTAKVRLAGRMRTGLPSCICTAVRPATTGRLESGATKAEEAAKRAESILAISSPDRICCNVLRWFSLVAAAWEGRTRVAYNAPACVSWYRGVSWYTRFSSPRMRHA